MNSLLSQNFADNDGRGFGPDGPWRAMLVVFNDSKGDTLPLSLAFPGSYSPSYLTGKMASNGSSLCSITSPGISRKPSAPSDEPTFLVKYTTPLSSDFWSSIEENSPFLLAEQDPDTISWFYGGTTIHPPMVECDRRHYLPNGSYYSPTIGAVSMTDIIQPVDDSTSFSLHLGSVALAQGSSFCLAGYEQNRVLGPIGLLQFNVFEQIASIIDGVPPTLRNISTIDGFLVDMFLGVEKGSTPFDRAGNISLFQASNQLSASEVPAMLYEFILDPEVPCIYLPPRTCEAVASYVPIYFNKEIGFWLWNTSDPQYEKIITSPSYLGFVLTDMNSQNITIKVPFLLLNLTLEPPIVASHTPYFPCQSLNNTRVVFGRAFLQAALFGVKSNTRTGKGFGFIAQAPGPKLKMMKSVLKEIGSNVSNIQANPYDTFADSWDGVWTPLPELSIPNASVQATDLPRGEVVGIAIGTTVSVLAALIFGIYCLRRKWRIREDKTPQTKTQAEEVHGNPIIQTQEIGENEHELGRALPHEGDATAVHEAWNEDFIFEAPAIGSARLSYSTIDSYYLRTVDNEDGATNISE